MNLVKSESGESTKPCLFCKWARELESLQERKELSGEEPWKSQFLDKSDHFFAVLDDAPRVVGDTMIISRTHSPSHYTDIADPSFLKCSDGEKRDLFDFLVKIAAKLKRITFDQEHGKIYLMSMCEYWKPNEIEGSYSTEHLHFHLLPRNKELRSKETAGEKLFLRPQGEDWAPKMLRTVRAMILEENGLE
jgi:diadenosine tetraphosphate (Ap4A) HIT family hydrolase